MRSFTAARRPSSCLFLQTSQFHTTRPCPALKSRRKPLPVPEDWRPFQASDMLLDLDSFDSPYVRPYDDNDEAAQQAKWAVEPERNKVKETLSTREMALRNAHERHALLMSDESLKKWRINDMDILSVALGHEAPWQLKRQREQVLGSTETSLDLVFGMNGIPRGLGLKDDGLLEWVLWRQKELAPTTTPSRDLVQKVLREYVGNSRASRFQGWRRFLVWVLRMDGGPAMLNDFQKEISQILAGFCSADRPSRDMLILLNNFSVRLGESGYDLAPELCRLGLVFATDLDSSEAMRRYLTMGLEKGHWRAPPDAQLPDIKILSNALVRGKAGRVEIADSIGSQAALIEEAAQRGL